MSLESQSPPEIPEKDEWCDVPYPTSMAGNGGESSVEGVEDSYDGELSAPASPAVRAQQMQEDWEENLRYQDNIMHAHRTAPEVEGRWTDRYMKLMVVGESGQGKTTFIQNMFMAYTDGKEAKVADGSITSMKDFVEDPAQLCTSFQVDNVDEMVHYHFTVQDTPGYGDDLNLEININAIVSYVHQCSAEFYNADFEHGRMHADSHDTRVDVCLYFIAAHRLKPVDVQFIAALAPEVAVIPVIAKADCMTTDEMKEYRKEVMHRLQSPDLPGLTSPIPVFQFSEKALAAAGVQHQVPPFAVVSSSVTDPTVGPFWPVRRYNWGTCEAFRSRDSDFSCLKHLVLELSYWEIRDATERRYTEYRKKRRQEKVEETQGAGAGKIAEFLSTLTLEGSRLWQAAISRTKPVDAPSTLSPSPTLTWELPAAVAVAFFLSLLCTSLLTNSGPPGADVIDHYLADLRDRDAYIAQLQGETIGLMRLLEDVSTASCLTGTPGAAHSVHRLKETATHAIFGDVCYDEDYKPGAPWLLRLLVMGSVLSTAWQVCNHERLRRLLPDRLSRVVVRLTAGSLALSCLDHIWQAFASNSK